MDLCDAPSHAGQPPALRPGIRRHRRSASAHAPSKTPSSDPRSRSLQARGPRGELRYRLQCHREGLYVEREETPCQGLHCVQSMQFRDVQQFERWCDGDPARFDHPLLHIALKRDGHALWQLRGPGDA